MYIILASKSRDRKTLLKLAGLGKILSVIPSSVNEEPLKTRLSSDPRKLVMELAREKAHDVYKKLKENNFSQIEHPFEFPVIIIGADTMIRRGKSIIGKPKDRSDALKILSELAGKTHRLITGVHLIKIEENNEQVATQSFYEKSEIHFHSLTSQEIEKYLERRDEYKGRAGAYSLRESASLFIDFIAGSPTNIIGLPIAKIRKKLKKWNIDLLDYIE